MGVCDDLFDVSVAAFRVLPFNPVSQARWHALNVGLQISRLLMEERFPIGEKKLDIPHLRCIDGRVVDLGDNAVPDGKPDSASSRVGGADSILVAVRPTRLQSRPAKCVPICPNSCHCHVSRLPPLPSLWSEIANLVARYGQPTSSEPTRWRVPSRDQAYRLAGCEGVARPLLFSLYLLVIT